MNRDDLFWVVVKSFGIVVLFAGLHGLLSAFMHSAQQPVTSPLLLTNLFTVGVGAYALFGGSWLFRAARSTPIDIQAETNPERP